MQGAAEFDIGANPSAEGGDDEGVADVAVKVVDIVDTFRLQVIISLFHGMSCTCIYVCKLLSCLSMSYLLYS